MHYGKENKIYDVIIVGAGPAGCACALRLADSGLKIAIIDKASFPRDKVCGDAIPGRAIKVLNSINPAYGDAFRNFPKKLATKRTSVFYKQQKITFKWVLEAYTCTRIEFDNFLLDHVKKHTTIDIYTDTEPLDILLRTNKVSLTTKNGKTFESRMIIGADGAHSVVARQLTGNTVDRDHYVGSVRSYYTNVQTEGDDVIEVYFDKKYLPSYLWVFPLPGNNSNVGFGMLSSEISKRKVNLKKTFHEILNSDPILKQKFSHATQNGDLQGFGLPLGSHIQTISGNNFMLAGDAASLIDPISGDGIGNAILSGKLAAEQVRRCFSKNDFSASYMKRYDNDIAAALGKELRTRYKMQRIISKMPYLLDILFLAARNRILKKLIQKTL